MDFKRKCMAVRQKDFLKQKRVCCHNSFGKRLDEADECAYHKNCKKH